MDEPDQDGRQLRIGELSRRVGVNPEVLRAWERRYGLLTPARTRGGFRLYGPEDERRIRSMVEHIAGGVSAAEAARLAREPAAPAPGVAAHSVQTAADAFFPALAQHSLPALAARLEAALDEFDDVEAQVTLDRLFGSFALDVVLSRAVLPYLADLGARWERGELSVAQEHFASSLLQGRLLALARDWGDGIGPRALLACLPGEQHQLGLLCFGLVLHGHGWRITYFGPDTPLSTLARITDRLQPALVVVTATVRGHAAGAAAGLRDLADLAPLALAGAGITAPLAEKVGARYLEGGPVAAAAAIATHGVSGSSSSRGADRLVSRPPRSKRI